MTFVVPIAESDVTNLVTDLAAKAPLASPTLTSTPSFPTGTTAVTQTAANSTTALATTAFATTADNLKANLASPTLTGTVTTPAGAAATDLARYSQIPVAGAVDAYTKVVFRTGDATPSTNITIGSGNDDTLLFAVGANDRWWVEGFLTFTSVDNGGAATTMDMKIGWSVPASGAMQWGYAGVPQAQGDGYGSSITSATPVVLRTAAQQLASGSAALTYGVAVSGYYTGGGTSGTVTLQWCGNNSSSTATLGINKNSVLLLQRIA